MISASDLLLASNLPYDLLESVFSFLAFEDQLQCLLVFKPWLHFIMDLSNFTKSCLVELPSLANNKDAATKLHNEYLLHTKTN